MNRKYDPIHLLEFTVENYRSIRDAATLSTQVGGSNKFISKFIATDQKTYLMHDIALYGANASGKSNIIRALFIYRNSIVGGSVSFDTEPVEPFLLDEMSKTRDTVMESVFEYKKETFIHGFKYSSKQKSVVHEWLKVKPAKKSKFVRIFERKDDELIVNTKLPVDQHGISRAYAKMMKPDELLIATVSNTSEDNIAKEIRAGWSSVYVSNTLTHDPINEVANILYRKPEIKESLLPLLQEADLGIADIRVTRKNNEELTLEFGHLYNTAKSTQIRWFDGRDQESAGTMKFFSFALPLLTSLSNGSFMALDELGSTLHPDLLRYVVKLFRNPRRNPYNAQLILTTHDTSLMKDLFNKNQVYVTNKPSDRATRLYALSDIKGIRNDLTNMNERYLRGDFGGVPTIVEG